MKCRLLALSLGLLLLLSGCEFVSDTYTSVIPHADNYPQVGQTESTTVENYTELKNALLSFVEDGVEKAVLTTEDYDGDPERDFDLAAAYVTQTYPSGAYLVKAIDRTLVRVGTYYKLNLTIEYRRSRQELDSAYKVLGTNGVRFAIESALQKSEDHLLLRVSHYEPMDFERIVAETCARDLTAVIAQPEVSVGIYPNQGNIRLVELDFTYPYPSAELRIMQSAVNTIMNSAYGYVSYVQRDLEKAVQLYSFLAERYGYSIGTSTTPAYSLFFEGITDSRTFAAVYSAMCTRAGLKCTVVHGTKDGEAYDWNILELSSGTWHIDPLADEQAKRRDPQFLTDEQMIGYAWDTEAYPACLGAIETAELPQIGVTQTPAQETEQMPDDQPEMPTEEPESTEEPELPPEESEPIPPQGEAS